MCFHQVYSWSYLNLFKSISVATGKTLSRAHSPTSTASQELHRKCHFWPLSRSCTITLLTYLCVTSIISTNSSLTVIEVSQSCPVTLTMQGVLLSCRATAWCSADLPGRSVWSAETCPSHPSQTLASQSLSGGGAHFPPLYPEELWSPKSNQDEQIYSKLCLHHNHHPTEAADRYVLCWWVITDLRGGGCTMPMTCAES